MSEPPKNPKREFREPPGWTGGYSGRGDTRGQESSLPPTCLLCISSSCCWLEVKQEGRAQPLKQWHSPRTQHKQIRTKPNGSKMAGKLTSTRPWASVCESQSLSCVCLFATPWTIQSMEFSWPEYWSGWLFPFPGGLPNPGLLLCRRILYQLSHQGSPDYIYYTHIKWLYPFSKRWSMQRHIFEICAFFCIFMFQKFYIKIWSIANFILFVSVGFIYFS